MELLPPARHCDSRSRFGHSTVVLILLLKVPLPWPAVIASASGSFLHANQVPSGERKRGWELRRPLNSGSSTRLPPEHKSTAAGSTRLENQLCAGWKPNKDARAARSLRPVARRAPLAAHVYLDIPGPQGQVLPLLSGDSDSLRQPLVERKRRFFAPRRRRQPPQ